MAPARCTQVGIAALLMSCRSPGPRLITWPAADPSAYGRSAGPGPRPAAVQQHAQPGHGPQQARGIDPADGLEQNNAAAKPLQPSGATGFVIKKAMIKTHDYTEAIATEETTLAQISTRYSALRLLSHACLRSQRSLANE